MDALDFLNRRRSVPSRLLTGPGPDDRQLDALLNAALRVPDHGRLAPWRLLLLRGEARRKLGERLAERARALNPQMEAAALDKERGRFLHAPLVVVVVATPVAGHKVPVLEQLLSGGALCFALLQGAQALGFGAQWLTSWAAYDRPILDQLGLAAHEQVLGFIHIGSATGSVPEAARPRLASKCSDWAP